MPILSAENNFRKGLSAIVEQNHIGAAVYFRRAMDIERQRHVRQPDMRYLSYYGLCRAKGHGKYQEAIRACRTSVFRRPRDIDMHLNLGRVYMMCGRPTRATEAFQKGLTIAPKNQVLLHELCRAERALPPRLARTQARKTLRRLFRKVAGAFNRSEMTSH